MSTSTTCSPRSRANPDALDELLSEQNYRLAYWRVASDELDYRRFFDITTLVGVRVEQPSVFDDTHRLVLDLVRGGAISGLRIDHVDGLRDPFGYLTHLRTAAPDVWLIVEKILADDESLPVSWPVDGTTGYEFANRVADVFVDASGARALTDHVASWTGEAVTFGAVAHAAQLQVMRRELAAEVERVTGLLDGVCRDRRRHRDHTRRELRDVVRELAATLDVYRTYVVPGSAVDAIDRRRITELVAAVAEARPDIDSELLDLLRRVLVLDEPGSDAHEVAARFQQLSAPVTAKGIEDTAFYRWVPLLSRNEVGSDPGAIGRGVDPFHQHNATIAARWPASMLALSTHDTKRSADVRARLAVLSQIAGAWTDTIDAWRKHNANRVEGWDDPVMELTLYQTLVGAWPIDAGRVEAALLKAAKEAKVHTSWRDADETYEANLQAFVRAVMSDASFVASIEAFLDEHDLVHFGRVLSLAQLALQLTSPGVPDTYQGDETWDLSLVDPDNRRPIDFPARMTLLHDIAGAEPETVLAREDDGAPKLWLLHRLLEHRGARPDLYEAREYEPLLADGPHRDDVVAFARDRLVTVAPRHIGGVGAAWTRTQLTLPPGTWSDVLVGGSMRTGTVDLRALFETVPGRGARATSSLMRFEVWAPRADRVDVVVDGVRVPMVRASTDSRFEADADARPGSRMGSASTAVRPARSPIVVPARRDPRGLGGVRPFGVRVARPRLAGPRARRRGALRAPRRHLLARGHVRRRNRASRTPGGAGHHCGRGHAGGRGPRLARVGLRRGRPVRGAPDLGGPDALKRFVDASHGHGLGVLVDVVYNHLGPTGNYLAEFGPYFTDRHRTPWATPSTSTATARAKCAATSPTTR